MRRHLAIAAAAALLLSSAPMLSSQLPLPRNSQSRAPTASLKLRPNLAWKVPATATFQHSERMITAFGAARP